MRSQPEHACNSLCASPVKPAGGALASKGYLRTPAMLLQLPPISPAVCKLPCRLWV